MRAFRSPKPAGRNERRSAAWGKRLSVMFVAAAALAFAQPNAAAAASPRIASELLGLLAKAKLGSAKGETVKVIVQYRVVPTAGKFGLLSQPDAHGLF